MVIANDVDKWFNTSAYDKGNNRPLPTGKVKVLGKFKNELNRKIMIENCNPRAKTYAFKIDDDTETKKAKDTKKCVIKHMINLMITNIRCLKIKQYYYHN